MTMDTSEQLNEEFPSVIYMPANQFDQLVATLDEPDNASGLLHAVKRNAQFPND